MAKNSRTNYGKVSTALCGVEEKPCGQGGLISIQEHLSAGTSNNNQQLIYRWMRPFCMASTFLEFRKKP